MASSSAKNLWIFHTRGMLKFSGNVVICAVRCSFLHQLQRFKSQRLQDAHATKSQTPAFHKLQRCSATRYWYLFVNRIDRAISEQYFIGAACLQNCPRKYLNRYEKWFENAKKDPKNDPKRVRKCLSPSHTASKSLTGPFLSPKIYTKKNFVFHLEKSSAGVATPIFH